MIKSTLVMSPLPTYSWFHMCCEFVSLSLVRYLVNQKRKFPRIFTSPIRFPYMNLDFFRLAEDGDNGLCNLYELRTTLLKDPYTSPKTPIHPLENTHTPL